MTDKEKLQKLFDAALKAPTDCSAGIPKRALPIPLLDAMPTAAPVEQIFFAPPANTLKTAAVEVEESRQCGAPTMAKVLDDAASAELAVLLDEQHLRRKRRHRLEALVAAVVVLGSLGGGALWFVQSPARVQAFKGAIRDIHSVGEGKSVGERNRARQQNFAQMAKDNAGTAEGDLSVHKDGPSFD